MAIDIAGQATAKVAVVVVAAGRGTRMGQEGNKVFLTICGIPVLARTLQAFIATGVPDQYVVVVGPGEEETAARLVGRWCPGLSVCLTEGGTDRQASVYKGLQVLDPDISFVLVHDGARPFVSPECIRACAEAMVEEGAACVGVPVKDTIKRVDTTQHIVETPDRLFLWQVQTPQGFRVDWLLRAHRDAFLEGFHGTDDASLVERFGEPVRMVMGQYRNLKLTTAEDLAFAEALLGK